MILIDQIRLAISNGAVAYANLSGGKDGQAMLKHLVNEGIPVEGVMHCDLGRTEWPQSLEMCRRSAAEFNLPLHIIKRRDGLDMLAYWQRRMHMLKGTGNPFWSSAKARYCTSDLKREPSNQFYRSCGHNFILSMEGIRGQESKAREKKDPFTIRPNVTSSYYDGMTAMEAIEKYNPEYRLVINCYPIFHFSTSDVWEMYGMGFVLLFIARSIYKDTGKVPAWWTFHPAYAMGNDRVSCMLCVLGSPNDLANGAKHNPELLQTMIEMEDYGDATFKNGWSLKQLL